MSVRRLLPLLLLVCLGLACGSSSAPETQAIVFNPIPQRGEVVSAGGMNLARGIIAHRLVKLGVKSATVSVSASNDLLSVNQVPCADVPANFASVASETGQLQFFDFEKDLAPPTVKDGNPTPYPTLYSLLTAVKAEASEGTPEAYYLLGGAPPHRVLQGPAGTRDELRSSLGAHGGTASPGTILAVPANREVVSGTEAGFTASTSPVGKSPNGTYWYLLKLPSEISGSDLKRSEIDAGTDPTVGVPQVTLAFTKHGAQEFQAITKAEYDRGKLLAGLHGSAGQLNQRYVQHNAIVLDNRLQATPYIDYTDNALSLGIPGGSAVISNMVSKQAARNLALVLKTGALPYLFEQVSSKSCGR